MTRRFVILDRDGTLIEERNYLCDPTEVALLPGAAALAELRTLGWGLVLITNQSGIGRGYFTCDQLKAVHDRLIVLLGEQGTSLDGIYVCPHRPEEACACRKPKPGLLHTAAAQLNFDPASALVVGDKASDLALGRAVGATTCLVRTGYGRSVAQADLALADHVLDDLGALPRLVQAGPPARHR